MKTEEQMRDEEVPTFDTLEQLNSYIKALASQEHDYGTAAYSVSLAATATFNYMAHRMGITGFQASCADLDIIRRTRHLDGPFILIKGEDELFPQYDNVRKLAEAREEWKPWLKEQAKQRLATSQPFTVDRVVDHWKKLAGVDDGNTESGT